jgi:putative methyltransferase (TIGR04325 family)
VLERLAKKVFRAASGTARDLFNERRFHRFDDEPVYSGIYRTYDAAIQAVPRGAAIGFDDASVPGFYLDHHFVLNPNDYPVLFWLAKILKPGSAIFDFGGGLGQCWYSYEPYLQVLDQARWIVCDLPAFVRQGQELAREQAATDLQFTSDLDRSADAAIFMSNGALQYMADDLPTLLGKLRKAPDHVVINRVPMYDGEAYYTIQRTRHNSYAPYRIMNREEFCRGMRLLGYREQDRWEVSRTLHVNFQPVYDVKKYQGFYFRKAQGRSADRSTDKEAVVRNRILSPRLVQQN